ncbi:MAG TPA: toxin-antitoxin system HicB family antitoxin [Candidatus Acidoferrum sp.]|nr:toxin-antitoxin system HicB family antitoxin [Candidatus Acidoferrum sp.]
MKRRNDTYPLKLPHSIKKAAQRLAKEDGVSLNQWIAAAVAEKMGVVETAAEFSRNARERPKGMG